MIQLVIGQIYFGTEGPHGWLGKVSGNDQLFKQIRETPECESKPCSSYPAPERLSSSTSTSPIIDDKDRKIDAADNSESLRIRWNLVIKQGKGNKTTLTQINWKPKDEKDKDKPPISEKIPNDKDKDTTPIDEKVPGDKDKDMTPIDEKIPSNKDTALTPAPLVQVYVVASGNGGAHTNIGDGGYYGRNNGYAISTGSVTDDGKNKWSGGFSWDEKDWKDAQPRIPSQDWKPSSSWRIEDQKDVSKHIAQIDEQSVSGGFGMPLGDKLGEASTKYRIGYLGLNLNPQSLAARTREKFLNWRLRFRR